MGPLIAAALAFVATPLGAFLVRMVVSYAIGKVMEDRANSKRDAANASRAIMVNKSSNNDPIPVLYGKTRIGGTRAYMNTSNGNGDTEGTEYLNLAVTMCEGEIGDIKQLWFNDAVVWDIDDTGVVSPEGVLSGWKSDSIYIDSLDDAACIIRYHNGSDAQAVDSGLVTSIGSDWTANHTLSGVAYLSLILKAAPKVYKGGFPLVTATVEGRKIQNVANITAGITTPTALFNGPDVNPVDVLYDYLSNKRFGKGVEHDANGNYIAGKHVDLESFKAARLIVGSTFKINGVLPTSETIYNNIAEILESCNGVLAFQQGKYTLRIKHQNEPTAMTINSSHILTPVVVSMPEKSMKFNKMTAGFRNPTLGTDYNDDLVVVESPTYLAEDNGSILESSMHLGLIDDPTMVSLIATYKVNSSRYGIGIAFEGAHSLLKVEAGDIIEMELPNFGWTPKKFRVMSLELTNENTVAINAIEYQFINRNSITGRIMLKSLMRSNVSATLRKFETEYRLHNIAYIWAIKNFKKKDLPRW